MGEFGHKSGALPGGGVFDSWGAGPFVISHGGKDFLFEDSDRFGPVPLNKDGEISERGQFGARSPFWHAWERWKAQGRHVSEDDGKTCIWEDDY